jgi:hypothetical protein
VHRHNEYASQYGHTHGGGGDDGHDSERANEGHGHGHDHTTILSRNHAIAITATHLAAISGAAPIAR